MSKVIKNKSQRGAKKKYTGDDVKRYVGIISDEFRGHIQLVAEQHGGIMRKLEEHDQQFAHVNERFSRVDQQFAHVNERFSRVDQQFAHVNEQFRTVHHVLGELKEDLEIIKGDVAMIKVDVRKRVTYDEFFALTKRVALLEKKSHR